MYEQPSVEHNEGPMRRAQKFLIINFMTFFSVFEVVGHLKERAGPLISVANGCRRSRARRRRRMSPEGSGVAHVVQERVGKQCVRAPGVLHRRHCSQVL